MKTAVFLTIVLAALMLGSSAWAVTREISQPVQVTSDSYYERGQAVTFDGSQYWLFYGRSAGVTGYYQNSNPDTHDYEIFYKKASQIEDLPEAAASQITGPSNSCLGEIGAVVFDGDVWVFATIDSDPNSSGDHAEIYGWWTDDGGANWNQVGPILTGLSDSQAHHNEYVFEGKLWIAEGSGNFTVVNSATPKTGGWSAPQVVGTHTGGFARFFYDFQRSPGEDLYLALFSPGQNVVTLVSPPHDSTTTNHHMDLSCDVSNVDPMTVKIFGDTSNFPQELLYVAENVPSSSLNYLWDAPVLPVQSGTMGLWHFDEGTGTSTLDATANNNDGSLVNGPVWTTSEKLGYALDFDGTNDYVSIPDNSSLDVSNTTGALTIEAWVYPHKSGDGAYHGILAKRSIGGANVTNYQISLNNTNGNLLFYSGSTVHVSNTNIPANQWSHIAVSLAASEGKIRFYKNGVKTDSISGAAFGAPNNEPLTIGMSWAATQCFDGLIDEIRLNDRILDDAEILNDYSLGTNTYYWRVEAISGNDTARSEIRRFFLGSSLKNTMAQEPFDINLLEQDLSAFSAGASKDGAFSQSGVNYIYHWDKISSTWDKIDEAATKGQEFCLFMAEDNYVIAQALRDSDGGGHSYITYWTGASLNTLLSESDSLMAVEGRYGSNTWSDMWPVGYTDQGGHTFLFFTSERDLPDQEGDGNIWYIEVDWDLSRNHYTYIQEGINDAVSGDIINILPGTYTAYDRALAIVDKNLILEGAGQSDDGSGTVLFGGTYGLGPDNTGLGINWPRAMVIQADNVTVRNMRIKGYQGDGTTFGGYGVVSRASTAWGVSEPSLDNILIEDITFADCLYGVRGQNVTAMTVQRTGNEVASGLSEYAVYINGSTGTTVRSNTYDKAAIWITDATGAVIGGPDPSDGNILTDIVYNGIWYGQQFAAGTSSDKGLIQNNQISGAGEGGIVVWNWQSETADSIRILDNMITGAAGGSDDHGGISLRQGTFTNLIIKGNVSTANGDNQPGLLLSSNSLTSAIIANNILTGNPGAGIALNSVTRGNLVIFENKIEGNSAGVVMSGGTAGTLDLSGNWWGSLDPAVVAGQVQTNMDYTPWLNSGVDQETETPGFQADLSVVWVDDDSPQAGSVDRIQEAADLVEGSTVNILDGVYLTNGVYVTSPMEIIGQSRAGVIIAPFSAYAEGSNNNCGFKYGSSDVTLKTMTIDGQGNPLLPSGVNNFRLGITGDNLGNFANIHIEDITVRNIARRGVQINNPAAPVTGGHVMTNCLIENVSQYGGISANYADCEISDCTFGAMTGNKVQIAYCHGEIHDNIIDCSDNAFGIVAYTSAADPINLRGSINASGNTLNNVFYGIIAQGDGVIEENVVNVTAYGGIGVFSAGDRYPVPNDIVVRDNEINLNTDDGVGMNLVNLLNGSIIGGPASSDRNVVNLISSPKDGAHAAEVSVVMNIGEPDQAPPVAMATRGSGNIGMLVWWCPPGNRFTIQNNLIDCEGNNTGIWLYHNDATAAPIIKGNDIVTTDVAGTDPYHGVGVFVTDEGAYVGESGDGDSYADVIENTITGFINGIYYYGVAAKNVGGLIADNNISGGTTGVRIYGDADYSAVSGNFINGHSGDAIVLSGTGLFGPISSNHLGGNTGLAVNNTTVGTVDASGNWWGDFDPALVAGEVSTNVDYTPWLEIDDDLDPVAIGFQGDYSKLWADDDSPQSNSAARVQEAVDLVTAAGTINLAAGTYEEQVVIDDNLTLVGAGKDVSVIQSPPALTQYFYTVANNYPVIYVHDADVVDIKNLTVDGLGRGNANYRFVGLGFWNAGGAVENVHVTGVRDNPLSGNQHGVGVYTYNSTGGPYTLAMTNVNLDDIQKTCVSLNGTGLTVSLTEVDVTGIGPTAVTAQNGIQVSYGTSGTITDCSVDGFVYTGSGWIASGMLFYQGGTVNITGDNTIANSQASLVYQETDGAIDGIEINSPAVDYAEGISLRDYGYEKGVNPALRYLPVSLLDGEGGGNFKGDPTTISVHDADITGVGQPGSYGIACWALGDDVSADIQDCHIEDWEIGVVGYEDGAVVRAGGYHNGLTDNDLALWTNAAAVLDFEENFWGSMNCADIESLTDGNIDFDPWCNYNFTYCLYSCDVVETWVDDNYCFGCPNDGHVWDYDAFATIADGISGLTGTGIVHIAGGTYPETPYLDLNNIQLLGDESDRPQITGGLQLASGLDNAHLEALYLTGNGGTAPENSVIRLLGTVTNLELNKCVIDGELVSGRHGLTGGQLESDLSVTLCEFKNILGWAVLDTRSGSGGDGSALANITFADNGIHDCNGSIVFRGLSTARTAQVTVHDNIWSNIGGNGTEQGEHWTALEINRAVDVEFYDNSINNVTQGLYGEGQALQVWNIDNLQVYENALTACYQGIYIWGNSGAFAVPGGSLNDNSFSGNQQYNINVDAGATGGPINAEQNYWGAVGCLPVSSTIQGSVDFEPWCNSDFSYCGFVCEPLTVVWADDDWLGQIDGADLGSGRFFNYNAFAFIPDAITAVADNGTVNVMNGLYDLPLNIENRQDINILGESQAGVVFRPTTTLPWNVASYGSSRRAAVRVVNSTGIKFNAFTMDFDLIKGNNVFGLLYWNATGEISNNLLENMNIPDATGGYYEFIAYMRAPDYSASAYARTDILNNTFLKTGRVGILAHDYADVRIIGNTFDKVDNDFGYAIEIGSEAIGEIRGNIFRNYDTWAASDQSAAAAVYIENAFTAGEGHTGLNKAVTIAENEIYQCQYGLYIGNSFPGFSGDVDINVGINDNYIHDNGTAGSEASGAIIVVDEGKDAGSAVIAEINGNRLESNGDYGIYVYTNGNGDISGDISENKLFYNYSGLVIKDYGSPSASTYDFSIVYNIFRNNLNAEDDAFGGYWDDGAGHGNCWYDFISNPGYPTQYLIPGSAGTADRHPNIDCGPIFGCEPGDVNEDELINILDIIYLIDYKFKGGPAPHPFAVCNGDVNCDCVVNILDIIYLIDFKFKNGSAPCSAEDWAINCDSMKGSSSDSISADTKDAVKVLKPVGVSAFK